ncbi:hypothetical protein GCM10010211_15380 [Streptomyces albospinus]|uniref:Uncharacterized protein n=2 Tax=Streptomyces albospinus TaxID=285515 RepID=A0ABQ2UUG4_9ACTN|nr:hypothetical protein GCM10010211_15380 [Streptomyces albospinus]
MLHPPSRWRLDITIGKFLLVVRVVQEPVAAARRPYVGNERIAGDRAPATAVGKWAGENTPASDEELYGTPGRAGLPKAALVP